MLSWRGDSGPPGGSRHRHPPGVGRRCAAGAHHPGVGALTAADAPSGSSQGHLRAGTDRRRLGQLHRGGGSGRSSGDAGGYRAGHSGRGQQFAPHPGGQGQRDHLPAPAPRHGQPGARRTKSAVSTSAELPGAAGGAGLGSRAGYCSFCPRVAESRTGEQTGAHRLQAGH